MYDPIKLECGCISYNSYDDSSNCKYHGYVKAGCNRLDYNPAAKKHQIEMENKNVHNI